MRSIPLAMLLLFAALPAAADPAPTWIRDFGTYGSGPGATSGDARFADTDAAGSVFVADAGFGTVKHYSGNGVFLNSWGGFGAGDGQFSHPMGIATDANGRVYVTDWQANRVQVFGSDGTFIRKWGATGSGAGQFSGAAGIAVGSNGRVYVADFGNHRIQMFQSSDGSYLGEWGGYGSGPGQLNSPTGVCIAPNGDVLVADHGNDRVARFTESGTFVSTFGQWSDQPGGFVNMWDLDTDPLGNIWVTDAGPINRVQKFSPTGTRLTLIGSDAWNFGACGPAYVADPFGVAVHGSTIYVVDANVCFRVGQWEDGSVTPARSASWGSVKVLYR